MSRTRNVLKNVEWGLIQKVLTLIVPFINRTVIIKVLGMEYLGLNSLFTSVLSILSLAELGISSAIISAMYKPIAENDTELVCALMNYFKKAYRVIGLFVTVVGLGIMPFLSKVVKGDVPPDVNIYILYIIYLSNNAISYYLFAYKNCLFIANQRNDVNSKIQAAILIVQNVIQIIMVYLTKNY